LRFFEKDYDTAKEDNALSARGQFLQLYPLNHLKKMTLDDYVIGKGTASFCACVEVKTRTWANMQGATALKFGIYYGKSKSDPTVRYRFTQKFGDDDSTNKEVFA
ncbi:TPA: hexulose-6-phosphate synthase, partial [Salmonella enterica subsp. enterica serovar Typhimurium]